MNHCSYCGRRRRASNLIAVETVTLWGRPTGRYLICRDGVVCAAYARLGLVGNRPAGERQQ